MGLKMSVRRAKRQCVRELRNTHQVHMSNGFSLVWNEMRLRNMFCDAVIHSIDNKSFSVHVPIMCAAVPYFIALFVNFQNIGQFEVCNVNISLDGETLEHIIEYAYTGKCDVNVQNVQRLVVAADKYNVIGLVEICCQFLIENLSLDNCLGVLRLSKYHFLHSLTTVTLRYVRHNFEEIMSSSEEFYELAPEELQELLLDDSLQLSKEEVVFEAVIKWTDVDSFVRQKYLSSLITCPRYCYMQLKYFIDQVMYNNYVKASPILQDILHPAATLIGELQVRYLQDEEMGYIHARPRVCDEVLFVVGGENRDNASLMIETYDKMTENWIVSPHSDSKPRSYHGLCVLNNIIFVIGGFNGTDALNSVRCYDPETFVWEEMACMFQARYMLSVCVFDSNVYALGGMKSQALDTAERYHPLQNQWVALPRMNTQRSGASAVALNDKIYIVGGDDGQNVHRTGEIYDFKTRQWTLFSSMTNPRSGLSVVAYNNYLYAIGGSDGVSSLATVEMYDIVEGTWQIVSNTVFLHGECNAVLLGERIFVVGGCNSTFELPFVEYWDIRKNKWYETGSLNINRSGLGVCVVSGLENAKEYSYLRKLESKMSE